MSDPSASWQALTSHMSEVMRLSQIQGLLAWDQQVNLPPAAHPDRGAHAALISSLIQQRVSDDRVRTWIAELQDADLDELQRAGLRNHKKSWERANKVPAELAARKAQASMEGYAAWSKARAEGDFSLFIPALETNLEICLAEARAIDSDKHPYDVMLDSFDPGTTLEDLRSTFGRLREGLVQLIQAVADKPAVPQITEVVDVEVQRELHRRVTQAMGYSGDDGRIDDAVHPFTVSMGGGDVRITTHLYDDDLLAGLGGTMHEAGHALYELGIPRDVLGSGIDSPASLGVHESQSRFWENYIGRSLPFFEWFVEQLDEVAPGTGITPDAIFRAANRIVPSPVRIYADEVTYNLHIIARFELEVALVEGTLKVADLPDAWNAKYRELLGIELRDDLEGVLQDVHWSGGTIGYFPSYTLGNLYAASLGKTLESELDLWPTVRQGDFSPVLEWLRDRVHRHGHRLDGAPLIAEAVGDVDLVENLLDYLWSRHGALHGVSR